MRARDRQATRQIKSKARDGRVQETEKVMQKSRRQVVRNSERDRQIMEKSKRQASDGRKQETGK